MNYCPNCGGDMQGDGYRTPMTCEFIESDGREPDADPQYCQATSKFYEGGE